MRAASGAGAGAWSARSSCRQVQGPVSLPRAWPLLGPLGGRPRAPVLSAAPLGRRGARRGRGEREPAFTRLLRVPAICRRTLALREPALAGRAQPWRSSCTRSCGSWSACGRARPARIWTCWLSALPACQVRCRPGVPLFTRRTALPVVRPRRGAHAPSRRRRAACRVPRPAVQSLLGRGVPRGSRLQPATRGWRRRHATTARRGSRRRRRQRGLPQAAAPKAPQTAAVPVPLG